MNTAARILLTRLHRLVERAAFLGVLFTLAGLFGRHAWYLELFTHFKLQLAGCFALYVLPECTARHWHHAITGVAFAAVNVLPVLMLCLPVAPQQPPAIFAPAARIRVLQANVLTGNRDAAALLSLVAREAPDVIVLQETNQRWLNDLAGLTNAYPVFAAVPREDNFGAAIYGKTNAQTAEILYLDSDDAVPSTRARLTVNGRPLTVIGAHPFAPYSRSRWQGRNRHLQRLAKHVRSVQGPCVVTGDFNNTPWSTYFQTFLADSGLCDSARGRCLQPTWPTFLPPFARIPLDHAAHSPDVRVTARRLGPPIGSDHLPVILDIAF
ncbi:MAG TPA: endonuclease/exonuclease/phosphatase family protein [Kiritimatiellia bacterium]|nr:endonuclease/exonuclease/phosphatase family protein [Kiritimatiellia bacterium]HRU70112.1 endonuclease/exonuclease/phosphatase family protein [Kiritimatiellia bacterium]